MGAAQTSYAAWGGCSRRPRLNRDALARPAGADADGGDADAWRFLKRPAVSRRTSPWSGRGSMTSSLKNPARASAARTGEPSCSSLTASRRTSRASDRSFTTCVLVIFSFSLIGFGATPAGSVVSPLSSSAMAYSNQVSSPCSCDVGLVMQLSASTLMFHEHSGLACDRFQRLRRRTTCAYATCESLIAFRTSLVCSSGCERSHPVYRGMYRPAPSGLSIATMTSAVKSSARSLTAPLNLIRIERFRPTSSTRSSPYVGRSSSRMTLAACYMSFVGPFLPGPYSLGTAAA